jgi:integrase/recombinase XerD
MTRNRVSPTSINCAIVALRFFFRVTLERADLVQRLTFVRDPRKASIVLSPEEVVRLLEAAPGVKYKGPSASPMARRATRVRGRVESVR